MSGGRWRRPRALGTVMAAVIMVVVIAVAGAGAYFAFSGTSTKAKSTTATTTQCQPSGSPICSTISSGHDVILTEPYRVPYQGTLIPFTADYTGTGTPTAYNFTWGDGTYTSGTSAVASHTYTYPGTYLASVQVKVGGGEHDNYQHIVLVNVLPSSGLADSNYVPTVGGVVNSNGTAGATSPVAILNTGQSVSVTGTYSASPSDPNATPVAPTLTVSSGGVLSGVSKSSTSVNGSVSFANPGTYVITMNGGSTLAGTTYTQNYLWTVFVQTSGTKASWIPGGYTAPSTSSHTGSSITGVYSSPHPGTLDVYEYTGSGGYSEDPAIDYETVGYEPILNVYQTLIAYNGSDTGETYASYVPELATCVPGSPECQEQWGSGFTGISANQENYTFVIDPNARFYDPATGASWGVYPSDVVFSLIRTMAFSLLPGYGSNNGWIITQALLGAGNGSWDGGIHGTFNNTPQQEFAAFGVNDSNCPAAAMIDAHGCVTIHADAGGHAWPYFLELIVDALGSSIVPCGWFSADAQGAGIPDWTNGTESSSDHGDHPCLLPGGATSTTQSSYKAAVAAMGAEDWDSWEEAAAVSYVGNVRYSMVGSGPYYMADYQVGASYFLKANPAYAQPEGCTWAVGCDPKPGGYAADVDVIWEITSPTQGEEAYEAGLADLAGVPVTQTSLLLKLVDGGGVSLESSPTLSIYFWPFDLEFNTAAEKSTLVSNVNVPSNWFSYVGMRQFFVHAFPYATSEDTIGTVSGIQYYQNYGGVIPHNMANYYQGNITWPAGDPNGTASTPGTAAWWYTQATTSSSPYYDPETSSCTTSSPCIVSMIGQTAAPDIDQRIAAWASEVNSLSGGTIQIASTDIAFSSLVGNSLGSLPGQNPMPVYQLGWAPDYPDPTDYVGAMYGSNGTYMNGDADFEGLNVTAFDSPSCPNANQWGAYAEEAYNNGSISSACQLPAFEALQNIMANAAFDTNITNRVIQYWQAEEIANGLALYLYWGQEIHVQSYASWISGTSLNSNVTIGGGQDNLWFTVTGNGVVS